MKSHALGACLLIAAFGCSGDDASGPDAGELINGCPPLRDRQAQPGDPIDGDTYETFAMGFFQTYCTRCHASTLTGDDRNGAPDGYNWDDEETVRMHRAEMRNAVGVFNFMPVSPPTPTCAERQRLVRWIDAENP